MISGVRAFVDQDGIDFVDDGEVMARAGRSARDRTSVVAEYPKPNRCWCP